MASFQRVKDASGEGSGEPICKTHAIGQSIATAPKRLAYGPSETERLDLYRTDKPHAPINIFIHGGAWRGGAASNFAYQAEIFMRAGAHHVVVDFINVEQAGGSLFPMV